MMEEIIIYSLVGLLCFGILYIYLRKLKNESDEVSEKLKKQKKKVSTSLFLFIHILMKTIVSKVELVSLLALNTIF